MKIMKVSRQVSYEEAFYIVVEDDLDIPSLSDKDKAYIKSYKASKECPVKLNFEAGPLMALDLSLVDANYLHLASDEFISHLQRAMSDKARNADVNLAENVVLGHGFKAKLNLILPSRSPDICQGFEFRFLHEWRLLYKITLSLRFSNEDETNTAIVGESFRTLVRMMAEMGFAYKIPFGLPSHSDFACWLTYDHIVFAYDAFKRGEDVTTNEFRSQLRKVR